ncbi:MAG: SLAC1 anion channel family protein [Mucilaginibacter sp.]|uniref:SLAC1 anion channel family protein n=1 Tax=Mucilaginibacter sp. TaxID=1882438 RepID=UPI0031A877DD
MENTDRLSFLEFLPVSIFGAVMGLSGLSFAWNQAVHLWHLPLIISQLIGGLAVITFIILTFTYSLKFWKYPDLVLQEFKNPNTISFFSTIIISLLLLPGILLPLFPTLAVSIWVVATLLIGLFAWYVLRQWLDRQQKPASAMPVWLLPVVGTLNVPIIGSKILIPGSHEVCLFFFSIGTVFAIILITIIFSRLIFQEPMPNTVAPTLMIMVAPLGLAFNSYENLSHSQDMFAAVLIYFGLFLLLLLSSKLLMLPRACPFQISWWAVSFPLATITNAMCRFVENKTEFIPQYLAKFLLLCTTLVILFLLIQTIIRIVKGTFVPVSFTHVQTAIKE